MGLSETFESLKSNVKENQPTFGDYIKNGYKVNTEYKEDQGADTDIAEKMVPRKGIGDQYYDAVINLGDALRIISRDYRYPSSKNSSYIVINYITEGGVRRAKRIHCLNIYRNIDMLSKQ